MQSSSDIRTLVQDIYELVQKEDPRAIRTAAARLVLERNEKDAAVQLLNPRREGTLRLSRLGPKCPCALWYETLHPEMAEQLPPWATIKYQYGHFLEAMAIAYTKLAGHEVTGEQDELSVDGIIGHRDCVIDGCIVDVKSTTSIGFKKFKDRTLEENDSFGYLDQLDAYMVGSLSDPLVRIKDTAYILAIDKNLGHMVTYEHNLREASINERIKEYKRIVGQHAAPSCTCKSVPDGKSGNYRLDTRASYSAFKFACRPDLRTFLYADGPRYLTHVERVPDVTEIDRYGKIVYH
jgi:hypothetical protein